MSYYCPQHGITENTLTLDGGEVVCGVMDGKVCGKLVDSVEIVRGVFDRIPNSTFLRVNTGRTAKILSLQK